MPTTLPLPSLLAYDLATPTALDVRHALKQATPLHQELWKHLSKHFELSSSNVLSTQQLQNITQYLSDVSGPVGLVGKSLRVRLSTYSMLASAPGSDVWRDISAREELHNRILSRPATPGLLDSLAATHVTLRAHQEELEEMLRQVAIHFSANLAAVTLLTPTSQLLLAKSGSLGALDHIGGLPIEWALCSRMVRTKKAFFVTDTLQDPIHKYHPLFYKQSYSYAGAPIKDRDNVVVASVCVLNPHTSPFNEDTLSYLSERAAILSDWL